MREVPWLRLLVLAVLGATVSLCLVLLDVFIVEDAGIERVLQPGTSGPAVDVIQEDFPDIELSEGVGHDGQQFYVVARSPTDIDLLEQSLDRPRYRLQRPLLPLLAWALHPAGGGTGLVVSFLVAGMVGAVGLGVAVGALSSHLAGRAWPAFVGPALPGAYASLRLTLADVLALGLVLAALFFMLRRHTVAGAVCAVLAVLSKEPVLVILIGHAVFRRTKEAFVAAGAASAVALTWWTVLQRVIDVDGPQVVEFTWPFGGVLESMELWSRGEELAAAMMVLTSFALAGASLWRSGPAHPLFGALLAATAFSTFLGPNVVGLNLNSARTMAPVLLLAIIMWISEPDRDAIETPAVPDAAITTRPT